MGKNDRGGLFGIVRDRKRPEAATAAATATTTRVDYGLVAQSRPPADGYQPLDADLTAIAAFASTGLAVRTATNTWAQRTFVPGSGLISVVNPGGVAGNIVLDADMTTQWAFLARAAVQGTAIDATPASEEYTFRVGPQTGLHTVFDAGRIQAKATNTTWGDLVLQPYGGNVGIRGAPSAWDTATKVLQLGTVSFTNVQDSTQVSNNAYFDGTIWKYVGTGTAENVYQLSGATFWRNAISGLAGGTVTWAEMMRLDASGNLGIGGSSFGAGVKVVFLANATTVPTTNPAAGGILYCDGGALKFRGSSGTVTTIAVA